MTVDFVIKFDPLTQSHDYLSTEIFRSLIMRPLKANKPVVIGLFGKSGEGKSWAALRIQEKLAEMMKIDLARVVKDVNVCTPFQYPTKLNRLLYPDKYEDDKEYARQLKKTKMLAMHEARTIISSKDWQSFTARGVGHVNAMSRAIKRFVFFIVAQDVMDITKEVRKQLNFYFKVYRPSGYSTRMYLQKVYVDDTDIENPKLRKTKISGYLVSPKGRYQRFSPRFLELQKPSKEIVEQFDDEDYKSKATILNNILSRMLADMKKQIPDTNEKVDAMIDWYVKNPEKLRDIGRMTSTGNWKINNDVKKMHGLTTVEFQDFMDRISVNLDCKVQKEKVKKSIANDD